MKTYCPSVVSKTVTLAATILIVLVTALTVCAAASWPTISTDQLKQQLEQKQPLVLIDARTPEEYADAHLVGAINIPEKTFDAAAAQLPQDKGARLIVYCNGSKCGKSKKVAAKIEPLGYRNIAIYGEGIPVWEERELPLVKGPGYGKKIDTAKMKPAELDALIKGGKGDYVIVDVRDEMEFEEGHIPTAINIPAESFAVKSEVLPKEKRIVVYCNTGSRSYLAYKKLIGLAYPAINQTLFSEWKEAGLMVMK